MKLRVTQHALDRMHERGITRFELEQALDNVTASTPTPKNSVRYLGQTTKGRMLKVWIVEPGLSASPPIVKSVADADD